MHLEQTSLILGPSVSTVTFFEGRPDVSVIRERVAAIIRANPWLKGRLVKQSTCTWLFCRYPGTNKDDNDDSLGEDSFTYSKNAAVRSSTQYNTLIKLLSKLVVKKGSQCVDRDESLFKVHVIVGEEDKEFAIIVSLSHIIADGSTFYSLYGMLSHTASVESLVAARFDGFEDKLKEMMRGNDTLKWVLSPGVIINIIRTLIFTPKVHFSLVDLDSRWIADEKRRLSTASSFVSTNDVLTSWYLSLLSNCDVGLMAMNFRNRMPEIGSEHAGNYEALLGLQKADMADARNVRRSVSGFCRAVSGPFPSFWQAAFGNLNISIVSTWSTFYRELKPNRGAKETLHMPIVETDADVAFKNVGIIFLKSATQYALLSASRSFDRHVLEASPAVLAP